MTDQHRTPSKPGALSSSLRWGAAAGAVMMLSGCAAVVDAVSAERPAVPVDKLTLSIDEVRRMAGISGLDKTTEFQSDEPRPQAENPNVPLPCRAVFAQPPAFGNKWTELRAVTYSGLVEPEPLPAPPTEVAVVVPRVAPLIGVVTQSVGTYPDEAAARAVFEQRLFEAAECEKLQVDTYDIQISRPDRSTVLLNADLYTVAFRVESTVLIDALVMASPDPGKAATDIVEEISDRLA